MTLGGTFELESTGIFCRCGYEAEDMADLKRHITSWERAEYAARGAMSLEHAED
jgi:hypothetical protein